MHIARCLIHKFFCVCTLIKCISALSRSSSKRNIAIETSSQEYCGNFYDYCCGAQKFPIEKKKQNIYLDRLPSVHLSIFIALARDTESFLFYYW